MSSQILVTVILSMIIFGTMINNSQTATVTPQLCEPGILEEMPQHIRKVCIALENSNQLANALTAYIRNEAAAYLYKTDDLLASNTGKRTDVDHVFLRFGRRR